MSPPPRWTISLLTIPSREEYLAKFMRSLADVDLPPGTAIDVVYNQDTRESPARVEARIRKFAPRLRVNVHFNQTSPSIGSGRAQQLNHCKTPLIVFCDDDLTLHGEVFATVERTLREHPLAIVGLPSLVEDTDRLFKPRDSTPSVDLFGLRFMPVQGMLVAGYRRLFLDVGGFNPRRRFWGEWTELNLRLWRCGFPTGYATGAYLRHWEKAPGSPTRNMTGRQDHVLWGLVCTALEYDAAVESPETEAFWDLVESRYIAYAFGADVSVRELLRSAIRITPRLASEYAQITEFRDIVRQHPFQFMPFHRFTEAEVREVVAHAGARIDTYRRDAWSDEGAVP
jgi:hypothetical protein